MSAPPHIVLHWKTSLEEDHRVFVVQRSSNSEDWIDIATIAGAAGSVNNGAEYSYTDKEAIDGTHFYRLKIVANDEGYTYSNIKWLNHAATTGIQVSPNPATGKITLAGLVSGIPCSCLIALVKTWALSTLLAPVWMYR